mgnify:CR=1 FL=1
MIRELLQNTLDTAVVSDGVYSYWQRKTETAGQDNDEYIVYLLNEDLNEVFADDEALIKNKSITVKYYYRDSYLDTPEGRLHVDQRAEVILQSLLGAGFTCPNGYFDAGNVDDIGFSTIVFEINYIRLV